MKSLIKLSLLMFVFSCSQSPTKQAEDQPPSETVESTKGKLMINEMLEALGGKDLFNALKDVEYKYYYQTEDGIKKDVSLERYIYEGEKSWARYLERNYVVLPELKGELIQGFDGTNSWTTLDGKKLKDETAIGTADFMRKTNFYWFNMMFKLDDPGTVYNIKEDRTVDSINYKLLEVGFKDGVGDVQDTYLLYINPKTKITDKFLFTVLDFGRKDPLMMEVKYKEVNGLKWPVYRRYTPSNWEGSIPEDASWTEEVSKAIRFNSDLDSLMFEAPEA